MPEQHHHALTPALNLDLDALEHLLQPGIRVTLSDDALERISTCRSYLNGKLAGNDQLFYGINTGFGSLCNIGISDDDIAQLQYNLVTSHAVGTGDTVPPEVVRIMLLLKVRSLSYGFSAVRVSVVQRLLDFYNHDVLPVVFELGSLGASGDLAPLAHLSLPLIGLGEVWHEGVRKPAADVLQHFGWQPLQFQAKEALALLNGTQFSTAYAVWCLLEGRRLSRQAHLNAALGYDAFDCRITPLDARIHAIRPHAGQGDSAATVRRWLDGSEIAAGEKTHVQDPYAFRCVPQVHGASLDALAHVTSVVLTEVNSVTDNPNVFPDDDLILSGGNFHAQPIALALDYLAIALAELGSISERRVYQLIGGQRGLPAFLTDDPGLHSGYMIAQYTAASIVSQNKGLCTPASVDSIVSCNGQEDHVSMAANAGTKARRVALNLERLLAIEFMVAVQALEYRRPRRSSDVVENVVRQYRQVVPRLGADRVLHYDVEKTLQFLKTVPLAF